jgi:hypothetical protein
LKKHSPNLNPVSTCSFTMCGISRVPYRSSSMLFWNLWNNREGRRLTVKGYQEIGKLEGALQKRADATLKPFSEDDREFCRRIFLRLTQPGEGTEDTKRRVSIRELLSLSGNSAAEEEIIQKLANASLLTTEGDLARKDAFVEVAHKSIATEGAQVVTRKYVRNARKPIEIQRRLPALDGRSTNKNITIAPRKAQTLKISPTSALDPRNSWVATIGRAIEPINIAM